MWTFMVALVLLADGLGAQDYNNTLEGILFAICPSNQVVSLIKSSASASDNDRQWRIECEPFEATTGCTWSSSYDLYEQEINYNCPNNKVVSGFYSSYIQNHGERRWYFLCCSVQNFITFECRETPMVNYWTEDFTWLVPGDNYLTGVRTRSRNNQGDHRWSFNYCRGTTQDGPTVNSLILAANAPVMSHLTEGDVLVPQTKNANICENCKWPKSSQLVRVPYVVSETFSSSDKSKIDDAIAAFHQSTCVRFVPRSSQVNYISIVRSTGCWSYVGRNGGLQQLSLGDGCVQRGIIQHELIHALGFWHEQSRTDRDIYVKIHYENIQDGAEKNFNRLETNNLNVPYDYSSLMHYASTDFSKNGKHTITPLAASVAIGQRVGMSDNDIVKINKHYGCQDYLHKNGEWDNELDGLLQRMCPSGQAVSGIRSLHNNDRKDRLWGISCKAFKVTQTCHWSAYVNEYLGNVDFTCLDNEVITGAYSEHNNILKDRRWKFYCCSASTFTTFNCKKTPVINYWEEYFSWTVASSNFLTGVRSSFDSQTHDRRWSFSYCQRKTQ